MKRLLDIICSFFGLVALSPLLIPVMILVWLQDFHSPFYVAPRVGKDGRIFRMVKLRSMVVNADKTGVDSTSGDDPRIKRNQQGHILNINYWLMLRRIELNRGI